MNKNKQTINMMKLIWAGNIFSKGVYTFIAYNTYQNKGLTLNTNFTKENLIFLVMGILTTFIGTVIARTLFGKTQIAKKIVNKLLTASHQKDTSSAIYGVYMMALGAIETTALFGLVGFIQSVNVVFYAIMMSITVIGWIAANPFIKKQQYV